ncbi:MAG: phosphoserine phosphatase SerB, partial [Marmoricola sp.]
MLAPTDRDVPRTLLITLTGKDRPGVTSLVFDTLAQFGVEVLDIEQIVLRRRLILGLLVSTPRDWRPLREAMVEVAANLDMTLELDKGTGDNRPRPDGRSHVTVLGTPLKSSAMAAIAGRIADTGANIDRIERMARYPITAIDLHVSGADPDKLRDILAREAAAQGVDIAVQPANLLRRGMRLIVMDVDSTLIQGEVIEMLAAHAGCEPDVARITERAMRGELDFAASLRERVALLEGLDASALDTVYDDLVLAPGARTTVRTLKRLGYRFAIVSGGFSQLTDRLARDLGIDFAAANELEIVDGKLTGRVVGEIVDRAGKATALRRFAAESGLPVSATIAIGDGANDLDMLNVAGLGIAFNAKPVVQEAAHTAVNVPYMDAVMYLL